MVKPTLVISVLFNIITFNDLKKLCVTYDSSYRSSLIVVILGNLIIESKRFLDSYKNK